MTVTPEFSSSSPVAMVTTDLTPVATVFDDTTDINGMDTGCQNRVDMILTSQRQHIEVTPDLDKYIAIGDTLGCNFYRIGGGNVIGDQYR